MIEEISTSKMKTIDDDDDEIQHLKNDPFNIKNIFFFLLIRHQMKFSKEIIDLFSSNDYT